MLRWRDQPSLARDPGVSTREALPWPASIATPHAERKHFIRRSIDTERDKIKPHV